MKKKSNFLVMMGNPGCGKTYICAALIPWAASNVHDYRYLTEAALFSKLRSSMDSEDNEDYYKKIEHFCARDLLIFDDIGSTGQSQTGWRQEVIFELVDLRYRSKNPTIFTTNLNDSELQARLGFRTCSRLFDVGNTIIDMFSYPDLRLQKMEEICK